MFIVSLILLQIFVFAGLGFFLRHILTRNVTDATAHLAGMTKTYEQKEQEIQKKLEEAEKKHGNALKDAQKEAEAIKKKLKEEMDAEREKILNEAHKQSESIIERAHKTAQISGQELEQKINERVVERAQELIGKVFPEEICRQIHALWLESLINDTMNILERLNISGDVKEAKIISAFALAPDEKDKIVKKIEKKLGRKIEIIESVRPELVAGVVVTLGSLVLDGSFQGKLQEVRREYTDKQ
ncbi:MAG: F0F1 ATP synthase subunit delta [Candidatus Omnitrophota bacterium]